LLIDRDGEVEDPLMYRPGACRKLVDGMRVVRQFIGHFKLKPKRDKE
jgi:hypothetical protein